MSWLELKYERHVLGEKGQCLRCGLDKDGISKQLYGHMLRCLDHTNPERSVYGSMDGQKRDYNEVLKDFQTPPQVDCVGDDCSLP